MDWTNVTTAPIDWDSPDFGGQVHVASNGSHVGCESA
jgi:hypothetical protein